MKVAGLQTDIVWEAPPENFRRVREMAARAVDEGARLLVLPEMFATGFSMNATLVSSFAAETREFMDDLARSLSVFVLGGYAEPADPRPANACSLVDPTGNRILHYRKIHPYAPAGEDRHYSPGERVETAAVEGVRVSPVICYDLRFPEIFRTAAAGTDLYCVLANWPEARRRHWSTLLAARAIENQAYVIGVNRVGTGNDLVYTGDSALLDPMGDEVASLGPGQSGLVLGPVDPARVARTRERLDFLKDRRPALYARLEESPPTDPLQA